MALDLNKVMIIGRLTRDPELRQIPGGTSVCRLGLATNFSYTNQQGQKTDRVEYHNIVLWSKLGEIAAQYLKKGRRVYIEGRLQTTQWDAQDGQKKSRTEVIAENMIMLDGGQGGPAAGFGGGDTPAYSAPAKPAFQSKAPASNEVVDFPEEELPTIQADADSISEDIPF